VDDRIVAVADVLSALVSVFALIAAVRAGVVARRLYAVEVGRDRERATAAASAQAACVNAWPALVIDGTSSSGRGIVISNASDSPVYGITAYASGFAPRDAPHLSVLPPGDYFVQAFETRWHFGVPLRELGDSIRPYTARRRSTGLPSITVDELRFRDRAGDAWIRDRVGVLRRDEIPSAG
jgi:hypothetical protein